MMKRIKKAVHILLAVMVLAVLNQCYLSKQGAYLLRYNSRTEDIDTVLNNGNLPEDSRNMLMLVKEIKEYAVKEIGLKDDKNYTRYVMIEKDYLVDVVSACEKDRFEAYQWRFPFFGSFPYKGFYEHEDAEKEAEKLRKKDLDVYIRKVDAFSTLGYFDDPVYSFMKDYSAYSIANLIIHEQTHATVFFKNRIKFNEELATFIGNEGALQFIRVKYGAESDLYKDLLDYQKDLDTFFELIRNLYDELNTVYEEETGREYKLERRDEMFNAFREEISVLYDTYFITDTFRGIEKINLNNAYIMSHLRYAGELHLFYNLYENLGYDLKKMVHILIQVKNNRGDPRDFIREYMKL
ncbi:MAG: aminopeptidase [Spirochaetes bacterium]|nr:aminopeptidase [Spirochaetota bacterium]